jgi:hypothetical protein
MFEKTVRRVGTLSPKRLAALDINLPRAISTFDDGMPPSGTKTLHHFILQLTESILIGLGFFVGPFRKPPARF